MVLGRGLWELGEENWDDGAPRRALFFCTTVGRMLLCWTRVLTAWLRWHPKGERESECDTVTTPLLLDVDENGSPEYAG